MATSKEKDDFMDTENSQDKINMESSDWELLEEIQQEKKQKGSLDQENSDLYLFADEGQKSSQENIRLEESTSKEKSKSVQSDNLANDEHSTLHSSERLSLKDKTPRKFKIKRKFSGNEDSTMQKHLPYSDSKNESRKQKHISRDRESNLIYLGENKDHNQQSKLPSDKQASMDEGSILSGIQRCDVCSAIFNGQAAMIEHLQSLDHSLRQAKALLNKAVKEKNVDEELVTAKEPLDNESLKEIRYMAQQLVQDGNRGNRYPYHNNFQNYRNRPNISYCNVCNLEFDNPAAFSRHNANFKHNLMFRKPRDQNAFQSQNHYTYVNPYHQQFNRYKAPDSNWEGQPDTGRYWGAGYPPKEFPGSRMPRSPEDYQSSKNYYFDSKNSEKNYSHGRQSVNTRSNSRERSLSRSPRRSQSPVKYRHQRDSMSGEKSLSRGRSRSPGQYSDSEKSMSPLQSQSTSRSHSKHEKSQSRTKEKIKKAAKSLKSRSPSPVGSDFQVKLILKSKKPDDPEKPYFKSKSSNKQQKLLQKGQSPDKSLATTKSKHKKSLKKSREKAAKLIDKNSQSELSKKSRQPSKSWSSFSSESMKSGSPQDEYSAGFPQESRSKSNSQVDEFSDTEHFKARSQLKDFDKKLKASKKLNKRNKFQEKSRSSKSKSFSSRRSISRSPPRLHSELKSVERSLSRSPPKLQSMLSEKRNARSPRHTKSSSLSPNKSPVRSKSPKHLRSLSRSPQRPHSWSPGKRTFDSSNLKQCSDLQSDIPHQGNVSNFGFHPPLQHSPPRLNYRRKSNKTQFSPYPQFSEDREYPPLQSKLMSRKEHLSLSHFAINSSNLVKIPLLPPDEPLKSNIKKPASLEADNKSSQSLETPIPSLSSKQLQRKAKALQMKASHSKSDVDIDSRSLAPEVLPSSNVSDPPEMPLKTSQMAIKNPQLDLKQSESEAILLKSQLHSKVLPQPQQLSSKMKAQAASKELSHSKTSEIISSKLEMKLQSPTQSFAPVLSSIPKETHLNRFSRTQSTSGDLKAQSSDCAEKTPIRRSWSKSPMSSDSASSQAGSPKRSWSKTPDKKESRKKFSENKVLLKKMEMKVQASLESKLLEVKSLKTPGDSSTLENKSVAAPSGGVDSSTQKVAQRKKSYGKKVSYSSSRSRSHSSSSTSSSSSASSSSSSSSRSTPPRKKRKHSKKKARSISKSYSRSPSTDKYPKAYKKDSSKYQDDQSKNRKNNQDWGYRNQWRNNYSDNYYQNNNWKNNYYNRGRMNRYYNNRGQQNYWNQPYNRNNYQQYNRNYRQGYKQNYQNYSQYSNNSQQSKSYSKRKSRRSYSRSSSKSRSFSRSRSRSRSRTRSRSKSRSRSRSKSPMSRSEVRSRKSKTGSSKDLEASNTKDSSNQTSHSKKYSESPSRYRSRSRSPNYSTKKRTRHYSSSKSRSKSPKRKRRFSEHSRKEDKDKTEEHSKKDDDKTEQSKKDDKDKIEVKVKMEDIKKPDENQSPDDKLKELVPYASVSSPSSSSSSTCSSCTSNSSKSSSTKKQDETGLQKSTDSVEKNTPSKILSGTNNILDDKTAEDSALLEDGQKSLSDEKLPNNENVPAEAVDEPLAESSFSLDSGSEADGKQKSGAVSSQFLPRSLIFTKQTTRTESQKSIPVSQVFQSHPYQLENKKKISIVLSLSSKLNSKQNLNEEETQKPESTIDQQSNIVGTITADTKNDSTITESVLGEANASSDSVLLNENQHEDNLSLSTISDVIAKDVTATDDITSKASLDLTQSSEVDNSTLSLEAGEPSEINISKITVNAISSSDQDSEKIELSNSEVSTEPSSDVLVPAKISLNDLTVNITIGSESTEESQPVGSTTDEKKLSDSLDRKDSLKITNYKHQYCDVCYILLIPSVAATHPNSSIHKQKAQIKETAMNTPELLKYVCDICWATFSLEGQLKTHRQSFVHENTVKSKAYLEKTLGLTFPSLSHPALDSGIDENSNTPSALSNEIENQSINIKGSLSSEKEIKSVDSSFLEAILSTTQSPTSSSALNFCDICFLLLNVTVAEEHKQSDAHKEKFVVKELLRTHQEFVNYICPVCYIIYDTPEILVTHFKSDMHMSTLNAMKYIMEEFGFQGEIPKEYTSAMSASDETQTSLESGITQTYYSPEVYCVLCYLPLNASISESHYLSESHLSKLKIRETFSSDLSQRKLICDDCCIMTATEKELFEHKKSTEHIIVMKSKTHFEKIFGLSQPSEPPVQTQALPAENQTTQITYYPMTDNQVYTTPTYSYMSQPSGSSVWNTAGYYQQPYPAPSLGFQGPPPFYPPFPTETGLPQAEYMWGSLPQPQTLPDSNHPPTHMMPDSNRPSQMVPETNPPPPPPPQSNPPPQMLSNNHQQPQMLSDGQYSQPHILQDGHQTQPHRLPDAHQAQSQRLTDGRLTQPPMLSDGHHSQPYRLPEVPQPQRLPEGHHPQHQRLPDVHHPQPLRLPDSNSQRLPDAHHPQQQRLPDGHLQPQRLPDGRQPHMMPDGHQFPPQSHYPPPHRFQDGNHPQSHRQPENQQTQHRMFPDSHNPPSHNLPDDHHSQSHILTDSHNLAPQRRPDGHQPPPHRLSESHLPDTEMHRDHRPLSGFNNPSLNPNRSNNPHFAIPIHMSDKGNDEFGAPYAKSKKPLLPNPSFGQDTRELGPPNNFGNRDRLPKQFQSDSFHHDNRRPMDYPESSFNNRNREPNFDNKYFDNQNFDKPRNNNFEEQKGNAMDWNKKNMPLAQQPKGLMELDLRNIKEIAQFESRRVGQHHSELERDVRDDRRPFGQPNNSDNFSSNWRSEENRFRRERQRSLPPEDEHKPRRETGLLEIDSRQERLLRLANLDVSWENKKREMPFNSDERKSGPPRPSKGLLDLNDDELRHELNFDAFGHDHSKDKRRSGFPQSSEKELVGVDWRDRKARLPPAQNKRGNDDQPTFPSEELKPGPDNEMKWKMKNQESK